MNLKFIRTFKKLDIDDVKAHLLVCGDLSASCQKCNHVGLKFDTQKCPACATEFKYIAFRSLKDNMPKVWKISELRPEVNFIDYDDFKKVSGALRAEEFFK